MMSMNVTPGGPDPAPPTTNDLQLYQQQQQSTSGGPLVVFPIGAVVPEVSDLIVIGTGGYIAALRETKPIVLPGSVSHNNGSYGTPGGAAVTTTTSSGWASYETTFETPDGSEVIVGDALERVWTLNLKGTGYHITNVTLHNNVLYAGTYGHLYAINPVAGSILWHLTPTGHAHSTGMNIKYIGDNLVLGSEGYVSCFSCTDGHELWTTSLPGTRYWGVNMVLQSDAIYVGSYSRVFGLRLDGSIMWSTDLSSIKHHAPVALAWVNGNTGEENYLLVGAIGYLFTIRPSTGEILKETSLKGTGYHIVTLLVDGVMPQSAYLCTFGHLFCCDPMTHEIKWKNELKGLGHPEGASIISIPRPQSNIPPTTTTVAHSAHTSIMSDFSSGKSIVVGISGCVACIDAYTGTTQWTASLPMCGYGFVTVNFQQGKLFASCWGKIFILDPLNGNILFQDSLEGLGHHPILLASSSNPVPDHSACTVIYEFEIERGKD
ncbi:hypothetical protein Pelo_241 [Pelomyxa schiedti]|nr:hypothetical protein Pelo_241 [Pelomyxa schiedti]